MSLLRPLADKVIVKLIDENEVVSSIGLVIQGDSKKTTVKKRWFRLQTNLCFYPSPACGRGARGEGCFNRLIEKS